MATELSPNLTSMGNTGALREFWIKVEGFGGLSSPGSATVVNSVENPVYEDLAIIKAELYVKTGSGSVATDLDIGLADDADGSNIGAELADGLESATLDAEGVKELGIVRAIDDPPVQPIWKAKGNSTDSFISTIQKGDVDASALVANLLLKCVPVVDMS